MSRRPEKHLLVMAKRPVPGQVKTRLHGAYTPSEAATIAAAAIADTLEAVRRCGADRLILALAGGGGDGVVAAAGLPRPGDDIEVVPQVEGSFGARLAAAWSIAGAPGLQIGMDTPQVTADLLDEGLDALDRAGVDAVLGPASDGGWWAIGVRRPVVGLFDGVAMSRPDTGEQQLRRMHELGLRTALLPELDDMDLPSDVAAIAAAHPHLRTAEVARSLAVDGLR